VVVHACHPSTPSWGRRIMSSKLVWPTESSRPASGIEWDPVSNSKPKQQWRGFYSLMLNVLQRPIWFRTGVQCGTMGRSQNLQELGLVQVHALVYVCMCMHTHMHTHPQCTYKNMYNCTHTHTAHTQTYAHTYTAHTCTYTYAHTHILHIHKQIHTHAHYTYTCPFRLSGRTTFDCVTRCPVICTINLDYFLGVSC
jgi:hypothetical protein